MIYIGLYYSYHLLYLLFTYLAYYIHKNRSVILDSSTTYRNVHLRNEHLKHNHIRVELEQHDCGIICMLLLRFLPESSQVKIVINYIHLPGLPTKL